MSPKCRLVLLLIALYLATSCAVRVKEISGSGLRPPPKKPISIGAKLALKDIPAPPQPPNLEKAPKLPLKESLSIPLAKSKEANANENDWWSHIYANAPENVKQALLPKDRRARKEEALLSKEEGDAMLEIQVPVGGIIRVMGSTKDKPETILERLESKTRLSAKYHKLYFGKTLLLSDQSLESQGVPEGMKLTMKRMPTVVVRLSLGQLLSVYVNYGDPVSKIKQVVSTHTGKEIYRIGLRFGSKELNDDKSLKEQNVPFGDIIDAHHIHTLSVRLPSGDIIHLDPTPQYLIKDVKALITHIPAEAQELKYKGKILLDSQSLSAQSIPLGETIDLFIKPGARVFLQNGQIIPINVNPTDTISTLKKLLQEINTRLHPDELQCLFLSKPLKDHETLKEQNVPFGSDIHCVPKPTVIVHYPPSTQLKLHTPHDAPITLVKGEIARETNLQPASQKLLYNKRQLDDKKSLKSSGVPFGGHIILEKLPSFKLRLPNGDIIDGPDMGLSSPVSEVEKFIANVINVAAKEISLSYHGKPLNPDKSLNDYDISFGGVIDVVRISPESAAFHKAKFLRLLLGDSEFILELNGVTFEDELPTVTSAVSSLGYEFPRLHFNGKILTDTAGSLRAQGVPDGGLLQMSGSVTGLSAKDAKKPDCDLEVDGPDCFETEEFRIKYRSFERRVHWVMVVYAAILFALGILSQSLLKLVMFRVKETRDRYIHGFIETVFRSITIVAIVIMIVEVLLNFDVFELKLENLLFERFHEAFEDFGISNVLNTTFIKMLQRVQFFLLAYLLLILFLAALAWRLNAWLNTADCMQIDELLQLHPSRNELQYAALRYEFSDSVGEMAVPGLDPDFYNFMEYLRSCYFQTLTSLVRFPNCTMLIGFFAVFLIRPVASWRHLKLVLLMISLQALTLVIVILIYMRVYIIKRKILPTSIKDYLIAQNDIYETGQPDPDRLTAVAPQYKQQPPSRKTRAPNFWIRTVYRTRYPNRHECLFFFWRSGPQLLERLAEIGIFTSLCVIAQTLWVINAHWVTWAKSYGPWPLLGFWLLVSITAALLPDLLWNMTIVTSTGELIRDNVLSNVRELQRADTIRRIARLIDALKIETTLYQIHMSGEAFLQELSQKALNMTDKVKQQNQELFDDLDDDGDGEINLPQLYSFLCRQGLNIRTEEETKIWFDVFDVNKNGGIGQEEFVLIVSIVKQLLKESFDLNATKLLLISKYDIDKDADIDINCLNKLIKGLHLQQDWTDSRLGHLIHFICRTRGRRQLTLDELIEGLERLEKEILGTLVSAVGQLRTQGAS